MQDQQNPNSLVTPKILANQLGMSYRNLSWLAKLARTDLSAPETSEGASYTRPPYNKLQIQTKSKVRTVYSPCNSIRAVQAMLVQVVLRYIDPGDNSRAYEPGMQLITAGEDMLGCDVIIGLDIKDFFHSIKKSMVKRLFIDEGYPDQTAEIMASICCVCDKYKFLPQGGISSAAIANRYAAKYMDSHILEVCKSVAEDSEFTYIRYSDNIYIGLRGDFIGYSILKAISSSLSNLGWRTHKFKVMPKYRRQKLLGMVVNGDSVAIQRTDFRKMCSALHNIACADTCSSLVENLRELVSLGIDTSSLQKTELSLRGKVMYYVQMSESNRRSKLKSLYSSACGAIDKYRDSLNFTRMGE